MLCMTYFLTAISLEQQKLQKILDDFQHHIQGVQSGVSTIMQDHYFQTLDATIKNFYQIEKQCQTRKVDMYLIPAIHQAAGSADQIVSELESMKSSSMEVFLEMQKQLASCFDMGVSTMGELCNAMKQYCEIQQAIMMKEETELVPLAQQALPFDVWFSISAKCLSDQENGRKNEVSKEGQNALKKLPKNTELPYFLEKNKPVSRHASS